MKSLIILILLFSSCSNSLDNKNSDKIISVTLLENSITITNKSDVEIEYLHLIDNVGICLSGTVLPILQSKETVVEMYDNTKSGKLYIVYYNTKDYEINGYVKVRIP